MIVKVRFQGEIDNITIVAHTVNSIKRPRDQNSTVLRRKRHTKRSSRRNMPLEYFGNPMRINPMVLLDTGAQVSCLKQSVFEQLKLPISILKNQM